MMLFRTDTFLYLVSEFPDEEITLVLCKEQSIFKMYERREEDDGNLCIF